MNYRSVALMCFLVVPGSLLAQTAPPHHHPQVCVDKETKIGYMGFKHCEYHDLYQKSFKNWNCQCYSGQCRPTEFRIASVTESNPIGLEVFINGGWFPVPPHSLRKEKANMAQELLQWMAHACASNPEFQKDDRGHIVLDSQGAPILIKAPEIECVWINVGS